jgi:hypothetical protein
MLLVTGQVVPSVPGPLVQLGSRFWSTFFLSSGVSPSTPSSSPAPTTPMVSTTFPASPPRFLCSGMMAEVQGSFPLDFFLVFHRRQAIDIGATMGDLAAAVLGDRVPCMQGPPSAGMG